MGLDRLEDRIDSRLKEARRGLHADGYREPDPRQDIPSAGGVTGGQSATVGGVSAFYLDDLFSYHHPRPDQIPKYRAVRTAAKHFAEILLENTPCGPDQSAALRKIREAVMTANAGIALDGRS